MRQVAILSAWLFLSFGGIDHIQARTLSFSDRGVHIAGGSQHRTRSVWARGKSLVIVFPGSEEPVPKETLRLEDDLIDQVRLSQRSNRLEVELRLSRPAEEILGRVKFIEIGPDLILSLSTVPPASLTADAKKATDTPTRAADSQRPAESIPATSSKPLLGKQSPKSLPSWIAKAEQEAADEGQTSKTVGLLAFAGLLIAAGGSLWWYRKKSGTLPGCPTMHISLLSTRALSARQKLVLVEAAGEVLLLSCTDKDVRLLRTVNSEVSKDELSSASEPSIDAFLAPIPSEPTASSSETDCDRDEDRQYAMPTSKNRATSHRNQLDSGRFVDRLSEELARQRVEAKQDDLEQVAKKDDEVGELDEKWAESIIRLRRNRDQDRVTLSSGLLH